MISITDSKNITLENSYSSWFEGTDQYGNIYVNGSSEINLLNNKLESSTGEPGITITLIKIGYSKNVQVRNNFLNFSVESIYFEHVENSVVKGNNLAPDRLGITLVSSSFNTINDNHLFGSAGSGIVLITSKNNTVKNNIIEKSESGIYLLNSSNNVFKNNTYIKVHHIYTSSLINNYNTYMDNTSSGIPGFDVGLVLITFSLLIIKK